MNTTEHEVADYLMRVNQFHAQVKAWLPELGLKSDETLVEISEERFGDYWARELILLTVEGQKMATLTPNGLDVLLTLGRIDLIGAFGEIHIKYYEQGGPTVEWEKTVNGVSTIVDKPLIPGIVEAGWYWRPLDLDLPAQLISREHFSNLLRCVSPYHEK